MKIITLILFSQLFNNTSFRNFYESAPQDTIFEKAIIQFKEKLPDPVNIINFPTREDSISYIKSFWGLLNRELQTTIFNKKATYADFSYSTTSYELSIHQVVLQTKMPAIKKAVLRPRTEAPIEWKFLQIKDRLIIFSYSPFKKNVDLQNAILEFENIYRKLMK